MPEATSEPGADSTQEPPQQQILRRQLEVLASQDAETLDRVTLTFDDGRPRLTIRNGDHAEVIAILRALDVHTSPVQARVLHDEPDAVALDFFASQNLWITWIVAPASERLHTIETGLGL